MSVLIKGMKMPARCVECRLSTVNNFNDRPLCDVLVEYMSYGEWETKRLDNCPLVEVPTPHGDLIDRDELKKKELVIDGIIHYYEPISIEEAPVIIPASKEGM